jgi:hypothetical protein
VGAEAERWSSPCCIGLVVFVSSVDSSWLVILVVVGESRLCKVNEDHQEIVGLLRSMRLYYIQQVWEISGEDFLWLFKVNEAHQEIVDFLCSVR